MTLPPCNSRTPSCIMLSHPEPPNDCRGGHHHWHINGWQTISSILFSRKSSHFAETSTSPPSLNAVGMRFYPLPSLLQNTKSLTTLGNVEGLCRKSDSAHSSLQRSWNQTGVWPSVSRTILRVLKSFWLRHILFCLVYSKIRNCCIHTAYDEAILPLFLQDERYFQSNGHLWEN